MVFIGNGVEVEHVPLPSKLLGPEYFIGAQAQAGFDVAPAKPTSPYGPLVIPDNVTTLVLKDIPYNLTVSDMQDELELLGFTDSVDLIHFAKRKKFMGYAFVNFVSAAEARRFAKVFVDYRFEGNTSTKRGNAQVANIQGLAANVALLRRGYEKAGNVFLHPASAAVLGANNSRAVREEPATWSQQSVYSSYDPPMQSFQSDWTPWMDYQQPWANYQCQ
eukprot:TRINITY_DN1792_c0_g2_i1.p1 TRINITY_DN1792_c0_g2~~TRINITY_DN1792_c0_g2_i1.p1  ORF type:complete len:219 (+),score=38.28 TRINITY_DN1792_c0_g2_i1:212-868(+)